MAIEIIVFQINTCVLVEQLVTHHKSNRLPIDLWIDPLSDGVLDLLWTFEYKNSVKNFWLIIFGHDEVMRKILRCCVILGCNVYTQIARNMRIWNIWAFFVWVTLITPNVKKNTTRGMKTKNKYGDVRNTFNGIAWL